MTHTDTRDLTIRATTGRDDGKSFIIAELLPYDMAGFMLRLMSALQVPDVSVITDFVDAAKQAKQDGKAMDGTSVVETVVQLMMGCDPKAVHALIGDILAHVSIAPDPNNPVAVRRATAVDIREMATLGQIIGGFFTANMVKSA
ncbi:tail assembly chaperone [Xanthomonas phage NEB7]|nr:tail assembly chaperone [Xanthomonas phage NEB7]